MKKFLMLIFLTFVMTAIIAQPVRVAVAANLRYVFEEIRKAYVMQYPLADISANFGSSGMLVQQIMNGAGYDLFMAADDQFPVMLKEQGFASGEVKVYAEGKLVLWSNTLDVSKGLEILTGSRVRRIAVAKPDLAPYGDRTLECLKNVGLYDQLKEKIIYADNISQTAQFAQTGNAEAAFLAMSLTLSPGMRGSVYTIPPEMYKPVKQAMVLVGQGSDCPDAVRLMQFILSDRCKLLFEKYGYAVSPSEP